MKEILLDFGTFHVCHDKNEDTRYLVKPMKKQLRNRITAAGYDPEWFGFEQIETIDQLGVKRLIVRAMPHGYSAFDIEMREV